MVMQDVSELGTILSIWAHPDDDAYLCGGIMAMATAAGSRQTGHPDHIAVHHWTLEAVRRTGVGALHVAVNTQESLDQNLARFVELGIIVGEQPVGLLDPLSIQLDLETAVLERKLAALAAQASQTQAFRTAAGEDDYRQVVGTELFGRVVLP